MHVINAETECVTHSNNAWMPRPLLKVSKGIDGLDDLSFNLP